MTFITAHEIPLDLIEVGTDRARDFEPAWAEGLAALIAVQGLLQPIIVRPIGATGKYQLVAGLHRTEACRLMGRLTIPAVLSVAASDDEARLEEVMENLGRYELIALDRCRHLYELKQIHERKYPQTKHGKASKSPSRALSSDVPEVFGFAKATAEKIGLSQTRIKEAVKVWTELVPSVRAKLSGSDLARKMTELKALSQLSAPHQIKVTDLILSGDYPGIQNVAAALVQLEGGVQSIGDEKRLNALRIGIKDLPEPVFDRLVSENAERMIAALKRTGHI